jgi:hypothetical protein
MPDGSVQFILPPCYPTFSRVFLGKPDRLNRQNFYGRRQKTRIDLYFFSVILKKHAICDIHKDLRVKSEVHLRDATPTKTEAFR